MKRVVRSKSGREIYGPKWQNLESSSSENGDSSSPIETDGIAQTSAVPAAVNKSNGQASESKLILPSSLIKFNTSLKSMRGVSYIWFERKEYMVSFSGFCLLFCLLLPPSQLSLISSFI